MLGQLNECLDPMDCSGCTPDMYRSIQLARRFKGIDMGGGGGETDTPPCDHIDMYAQLVMQFWGALACGAGSKELQAVMVPGMRGYGWSWLSTMLNKVISGEARNLVLFEGLMHSYLITAGFFLEGMYTGAGNNNTATLYQSIMNCPKWKEAFIQNGVSRWGNVNASPVVPLWDWCGGCGIHPTGNSLGSGHSSYSQRKKDLVEQSEFESKMMTSDGSTLSWIKFANFK